MCSARADNDTFQFGYSPSAFFGSVIDESAGIADSEQGAILSAISATMVYRINRANSFKATLDYYIAEFDANDSFVGQDVSSISIAGTWRNKVIFSRYFKPLLGVGLSFDQSTYENRLTLDRDGFLSETYPDREDSDISILLSASLNFGDNDWIETEIVYKSPIKSGLKALLSH